MSKEHEKEIAQLMEAIKEYRKAKDGLRDELEASKKTYTELRTLINLLPTDTDPQEIEADVKRAVLDAERTHSAGADKLRHAVSLLHDKGYNTENTLADEFDLIRLYIEAEVLNFHNGIAEVKAYPRKKAENSEAFRAKYANKRFTSSTAGKSHIYAYIYWAYLQREGLSNDELLARPLYRDMDAIKAKIATTEDAFLYNRYLQLEAWLGDDYEAALFMRNGLRSALAHFYSIASGAIAGENLKNALDKLDAQGDTNNVALWLSLLSVDSLMPTASSYEAAITLRANAENGLRYLNVHNTLISIIADEIEIPELVIFQMDMEPVYELISQLNEALSLLRDAIKKRETIPNEQAVTTAPPLFTEAALAATLEAFRDVSPDAPPIPEENIKKTERYIRDNILHGNRAWANLTHTLRKNYWRRIAR